MKRLHWVFDAVQQKDRPANRVLEFIQHYLALTRFVGRRDLSEQHRNGLNWILAFSGLEYGSDGEFR